MTNFQNVLTFALKSYTIEIIFFGEEVSRVTPMMSTYTQSFEREELIRRARKYTDHPIRIFWGEDFSGWIDLCWKEELERRMKLAELPGQIQGCLVRVPRTPCAWMSVAYEEVH